MAKAKITVIKKLNMKDIYGDKLPTDIDSTLTTECSRFEIGQEFIIDTADGEHSWKSFPKGFCVWAYADLQRDILHILFGGSYPWFKQKGTVISCCTDGMRPVIFKIERIED